MVERIVNVRRDMEEILSRNNYGLTFHNGRQISIISPNFYYRGMIVRDGSADKVVIRYHQSDIQNDLQGIAGKVASPRYARIMELFILNL